MELDNYKFGGHESFYFRKGWLYKGIKNIKLNEAIFTDKTKNSSDIFGLGVSMVKSLRYWLQAVGLTTEVKNSNRNLVQRFTVFGEIINKYDKYMEEIGTICLLHYKLATNSSMATSWYYFFNEFNMSEFNKSDYIDSINSYLKFKQISVAQSTIEGDLTCVLNTYLPKKILEPEDNMECPLSELGLIAENKKMLMKIAPKDDIIPLEIMLAMIVDQHKNEKEIKIIDLAKGKNNIGKLFNLNPSEVSEYLDKMQMANLIEVVRTAGLDVIKISNETTFEQCIIDYYESIKS